MKNNRTILGELFMGNLYPFEDLAVVNDSEYDKLGDKITEEREYFNSLLTP